MTFFALAFAAALFIAPAFFVSEAQKGNRSNGKGLIERTSSHDPELENYDIRTDKQAFGKLAGLRAANGRSASLVADVRDSQVVGEEQLKKDFPHLKVEYNSDLGIPEVIATRLPSGKAAFAKSYGGSRPDVLKDFLKSNSQLFGLRDDQIDSLKVVADYTNPDGNLSFVELNQEINGIPVFRGEVKAGFSKSGELFRVINNLAPGYDEGSVRSSFGDAVSAANAAAVNVKKNPNAIAVIGNESAVAEDRNRSEVQFADGTSAQAAKIYYPTEPGVLVPAWQVIVESGNGTYYTIVDADTGGLLWRKNLTEDQTQAATYNVYINPNAMINVADNPFPMTPGPISPGLGTQGAAINRTLVTLVGNEAPYTFNNNGWITDGGNSTDGNNVQAGLDRKFPNTGNPANPAHIDPDGMAIGSPNRVFNFPFNPGNPNTNSGDSPLPAGQTPAACLADTDTSVPTDYQKAITTQLFYITNRFHDETYLLGFTEQARNFQHDNFARGGIGGDRISAQAQDCSGTNNANFTTPPDGNRPTMQMYLWTAPNPDFDGSLDADVVIHEITHGVSNRLHGNSAGLSTNMARGMGEGWGDFFAHSMLSEPTDPIDGVYTTGGYATYLGGGSTGNYYHGIRRYPKAILAATGGANNKPHNAYTFSYINSDCGTRMNNTNFAFNRGPFGSLTCDQVHNIGEIWSSILWEARAKLIQRLGWAVGNRKMLQFVMDGMKLSPLAPNMIQERDAIIAAARASAPSPESDQDVDDLWAGFAARGLGFSAKIEMVGSGANNTKVSDGFDLPNLEQIPAITVSDAVTGDNDGAPEPGETVMITVPLANNSGKTAINVWAGIVGGSSIAYGDIANNGTASNQIRYKVPRSLGCGETLDITINVNSSLGPISFVRTLMVGSPVTTFTENFDSVTAPAFPVGWTAQQELGGINFVNSTLGPDTAPNSAFAQEPTSIGGGTSLTSPVIPIQSGSAVVSFRHKFNTEAGWDGGVFEVKIGDGAFQDILSAGGGFLENGYNSTLGAYTGDNNPIGNRAAWSGDSGGYITTRAYLPASAAGQNVQVRWRFGADENTIAPGANPGWFVDTVSVVGSYACSNFAATNTRSDFDGDGRTDPSVFRPSQLIWHVYGSAVGHFAYQWGLADDLLIPADYDKDGMTDVAVYRPGQQSAIWILNSSDFTYSAYGWGTEGDIPVIRDYDGDKAADLAVYRPSNGTWHIFHTSTGEVRTVEHGQPGEIPVAGDFDGDGKGDFTVNRDGVWRMLRSSGGYWEIPWGLPTDQLVPADYDGDGADDMAVFRPENSTWWVLGSSGFQVMVYQWGLSTDLPTPGDYDGDGRDDVAVYRDGVWWVLNSSGGHFAFQFGLAGDKPTLRGYLP